MELPPLILGWASRSREVGQGGDSFGALGRGTQVPARDRDVRVPEQVAEGGEVGSGAEQRPSRMAHVPPNRNPPTARRLLSDVADK